MGCLFSSDEQGLSQEQRDRLKAEKLKSKELEQNMAQAQQQDQQINKLLLLGAGESGKSTLFKQMITIYGKGFPEHERKSFTPIIFNNILSQAKVLADQSDQHGPPETPEGKAARDIVANELKGDEEIDAQLAAHLIAFWRDPGIQKTYEAKSNYQLNDSTQYFFDKIKDVSAEGYIPSEQDVLRARVRTTGIVENEFIIDGNQFKMFDVGGQRNERKKWIHCFENVTAVLFVAAISEYDQVLYEDENTNRMVEALNLFEEICNSRWFQNTSMILFLNKKDVFSGKILRVPITTCFPHYTGGQNYDECSDFIEAQFLAKNQVPDKQVYTHITCATDTTNIAAVFNAVKDIIIRKSLDEAGLV